MPSFGAYEEVGPLKSDPSGRRTLLSVRGPTQKAGEEFAVKLVRSAPSSDLLDVGSTDDYPTHRGARERQAKFAHDVGLQRWREASEAQRLTHEGGSTRVAPIYDCGRDERGVWYVTRRYKYSLQRLIDLKHRFTAAEVHHVLSAVVGGLADLQRAAGRAHGNLKPANVLVRGEPLENADIVITDLAPVDQEEARTLEAEDLRDVGTLLAVMADAQQARRLDSDSPPPLRITTEWKSTFRLKSKAWLDLANRLLQLAPDAPALTVLEAEKALTKLGPSKVKVLPIAAAAVVVVGGALAAFLMRGGYVFDSNPKGAKVYLTGREGPVALPGSTTPVRLRRLPAGDYFFSLVLEGYEIYTNSLKVSGREWGWQTRPRLIRSMGTLAVKTLPESGVTVRLVNRPGETVDLQKPMSLPTGKYDLVADYPGWEAKTQTVEVRRQEQSEALFVFSANTLAVNVDPSADLIRLRSRAAGGRSFEQTNLAAYAFQTLAPGDYDLEVQNRWFEPYQQAVRVVDGQVPPPVRIRLQPGKGRVRLTSNLTNTHYFLLERNGRAEIPTPELKPENELLAGTNWIEARLAGWSTQRLAVVLERGVNRQVTFQFEAGSLAIETQPTAPATFTLEGDGGTRMLSGQRGLFTGLRPGGSYRLRTSAQGFEDVEQTVESPARGTNTIQVALTRAEATLVFTSDPAGAELLWSDGRVAGKTPSQGELPLRLSPGRYAVRARYEGLEDVSTNVDLKLKQTLPVHFRFRYASLTLQSRPEGSGVFLSNRWMGTTPLNLPVLRPGPYDFHLTNVVQSAPKELVRRVVLPANTNWVEVVSFGRETHTNDIGMAFVFIEELNLWVGKYEVTEADWKRVMGAPSPYVGNDAWPARGMKIAAAQEFCSRLLEQAPPTWTSLSNPTYRLPTNTEWQEFAKDALTPAFRDNPQVNVQRDNTPRSPVAVDQSVANELGLYGLRGNVWEYTTHGVQGFVRGNGCASGPRTLRSDSLEVQAGSILPDAGLRVVIGPR